MLSGYFLVLNYLFEVENWDNHLNALFWFGHDIYEKRPISEY